MQAFFAFARSLGAARLAAMGAVTLTLVGFFEAIDIYVSNRLVSRGEVVLDQDKLSVTMAELIKAEQQPCAS